MKFPWIRVLFVFYLYASNRLLLFLSVVFVIVVVVVVFFSHAGVQETIWKATLCQKKVTGTNKLYAFPSPDAFYEFSCKLLALRGRFLTTVKDRWIGNVIST